MNGEFKPPRNLREGITNPSYQCWWVKWQGQVVRCQTSGEAKVALRAMHDGWKVSRGGDPDFFMSRGTEKKFVEVKNSFSKSDIQVLRFAHLQEAGLQVDVVMEPNDHGTSVQAHDAYGEQA